MHIPETIIGIGNRYRGDDAVGPWIIHTLQGKLPNTVRLISHDGETASLMDAWQNAVSVVLIDAVSSGQPPGTVVSIDLAREYLPNTLLQVSTHGLGVSEAVELARAMDKLPPKIQFYGIEAASFDAGDALSPDVKTAATQLCDTIIKECTHA